MFWTRIFFYITTEYNNLRIIPDIFKQAPSNKKKCNSSNTWFNHEDMKTLLLIFYDKKTKFQKKM